MKNIKFILLVCLLSIFSCQEVIDVDLDDAEAKLVVDASLSWVKGSTGNEQFIKLTLTAPFFDETIPPATGAVVTVTDANNNTFNFIEEGDTGIYKTTNFIPELNGIYELTINYDNQVYVATETLIPVAPFDYIEQNNDGGFLGDNIEIKAYYTDPASVENFYIFKFIETTKSVISINVSEDSFNDGNQNYARYSNDELEPGDEINIEIYGVSKRTYQFTNILLQQTGGRGPFGTTPATVRGNCVNQTNPDNYALGYFRVTEADILTYIVE